MFLSRDPGKSAAKARRLLAAGDALEALRMARKAQVRARPPLSGELAELAEQARQAVVHGALARAETAAAEGLSDDAAEWLRGALEYAAGEAEEAEIRARLAALRPAARARPGPGPGAGSPPRPAPGPDADAAAAGLDPAERVETLYEIYVGTLRPDLRELYQRRPEAFRRGVVAINEGEHHGAAAEALAALTESEPEDPVLRLERGRLLSARGELESALPDLAAAARELGDEPLDGESWGLSLPAMWCEAALELEDAAGVLERLEGLGEITLRDRMLSVLYGRALWLAGERDEAERFLAETVEAFPTDPSIAHLLAVFQDGGGKPEAAIATLERSLARTCTRGGCSSEKLEPEMVWLLAALHLDHGGPPERIDELLRMLQAVQGGRLEAEDWELLARYHERVGDDEEAARARSQAQRLAAEAEGRMPPAPEEAPA